MQRKNFCRSRRKLGHRPPNKLLHLARLLLLIRRGRCGGQLLGVHLEWYILTLPPMAYQIQGRVHRRPVQVRANILNSWRPPGETHKYCLQNIFGIGSITRDAKGGAHHANVVKAKNFFQINRLPSDRRRLAHDGLQAFHTHI
jgi:hypothetical protein